jgi:hypothetical protein
VLRIAAFIIALALLAGSAADHGWFAAGAVLSGLAALRPRPWAPLSLKPALDARLLSFVLWTLFAFQAVEAERNWLIALAAVNGVAAFFPGLISLDGDGRRARRAWAGEWRR